MLPPIFSRCNRKLLSAERQSDTESQTNEDSSDTNQTPPAPNYLDSTIKTAGKHSTFASNGTQGQNGLDRNSPARDISAKQKNFSGNAKKNNNKKARHR